MTNRISPDATKADKKEIHKLEKEILFLEGQIEECTKTYFVYANRMTELKTKLDEKKKRFNMLTI